MLLEGRHFRFDWSSATDVGHKAAAQNLADVAAMGARPTALLVGLVAPPTLELEVADGLADGLREECSRTGAVVVGGDMVRGDRLLIAVTALGDLQGRPPVTRAGARIGDVVVAAGRLGWSAAGLRLLASGPNGDTAQSGPLVAAHRRPAPPYALGPALAELGATSLIDVSDGLAADLGHVAAASGVGFELSLAALCELGAPGVTDDELCSGGEDHALVGTIGADRLDELPPGVVVIGATVGGTGVRVDGHLVTGGFDHFG